MTHRTALPGVGAVLLLALLSLPAFAAPQYAVIHYQASSSLYGDHTTGNFNDYLGLHLWGNGVDSSDWTEWTNPKPFLGQDDYGRFAWIKLSETPGDINFIVHRGDTKYGTQADRSFDATVSPEVWLRNDSGDNFNTQAEAQGFIRITYHREGSSPGGWGLHLWGDAIDPSEATTWDSPKTPDGWDVTGNGITMFFDVQITDPTQPVNFIIHSGDVKDPGPDQSFVPNDSVQVWVNSGDETIYTQRGAAEGFATIHYHRPDGDYGNSSSSDYNDFWGLHTWTGAANPPGWTDPDGPQDFDTFGAEFRIELVDNAEQLAYILHRGDTKDPGPDQFLNFATYGYEVWQLADADPVSPYILPIVGSVSPTLASLVINEIMNNPATVSDSNGEWFELYNPTAAAVDIDGWMIMDEGFDSHVIENGGPLVIPPGGYLMLGINADSGTNGGVSVDYEYGAAFFLANGADELILLDDLGAEIDRVTWDGGPVFPDPNGASMALLDPGLDNNIGENWYTSSTPFGAGDLGTPGVINNRDVMPNCIGDINVRAKSGKLQLTWAPVAGASAYDIYRSTAGPDTGFSLHAAGHVTGFATYLDSGLGNGVTYWYVVVPNDGTGAEICTFGDAVSGTPTGRRRR